MTRIVFVNRFFWPDHAATGQLLTDLTEALATSGEEVLVVTSQPKTAAPAGNGPAGVRIVRTWSTHSPGQSMAGKALDFGTFFLAACWRLARLLARGDTLVVMTDPPLLAIPAGWIARLRGARVVHWIQDIYPEVAVAVSGRKSLAALKPARDAAWRSADACVTLGRDMASVVAAANVSTRRIHIVPNWAPRGVHDPDARDRASRALRQEWGLADRFVVAYSGNLGRVHEIDGIIAAAAALRTDERVVFVLIGGGARKREAERLVASQRLKNVRFLPPQPRARLGASLAAADAHLVTMRAGCERFVFPSKLYGIAAVGRPILYFGPARCELADLIRAEGMGVAADVRHPPELADAIRSLADDATRRAACGAAAARFAAAHSAERAAAQWREILARVRTC